MRCSWAGHPPRSNAWVATRLSARVLDNFGPNLEPFRRDRPPWFSLNNVKVWCLYVPKRCLLKKKLNKNPSIIYQGKIGLSSWNSLKKRHGVSRQSPCLAWLQGSGSPWPAITRDTVYSHLDATFPAPWWDWCMEGLRRIQDLRGKLGKIFGPLFFVSKRGGFQKKKNRNRIG